MSQVEQAKYTTIKKFKNIEIREYQPMLIAQVEVPGERKEAISKGFRLLANYIFGNNTQQDKIAMTAPVSQQSSEKIAMTAPVTQTQQDGEWLVRFTMPAKYTLSSLPKPNNKNVKIIEQPAEKFIVIRFSGRMTAENLQKHLERLKSFVREQKMPVTRQPVYAFYNPPWTLPFLRRNEIMWAISEKNN